MPTRSDVADSVINDAGKAASVRRVSEIWEIATESHFRWMWRCWCGHESEGAHSAAAFAVKGLNGHANRHPGQRVSVHITGLGAF